jgi:cytosine/adenosine deaminase-related metal-dependent hydrolase
VKTLVSAAYVATMAGPIVRDGAILCDNGFILAVGNARELRAAHPDAENHLDLGNALLLPGLVNAHTHLELTALGQLAPPRTFVDWVLDLRNRIMDVPDLNAFIRTGTRAGLAQCQKFGVTTVGDITLNPALTRPILREAHMTGVSFGEVLGMAGRREQLEPRLAAAVTPPAAPTLAESDLLSFGIEPHAPYSLDLPGYRRCVTEAVARSMPLATHLAETPDEVAFLASGTGEFARLWHVLGDWREDVPRFEGGPIRAMAAVGLLDRAPLLAHVNYADDDELALLAGTRASVVYCPRTHAYFGHPPHRFADMLRMGINVALGTDSAASSPDLNPLEEARLVHRIRPDLPTSILFEMITTRGARALGMEGIVGRLAPGMRACYCAFPVRTDDPLTEVLETDATVTVGSGRAS